MRIWNLPKSWLVAGGLLASSLSITAFHFGTVRRSGADAFETAFSSLFPTMLSSYARSGKEQATTVWQLPSYQEYVAGQTTERSAISLSEQDLQPKSQAQTAAIALEQTDSINRDAKSSTQRFSFAWFKQEIVGLDAPQDFVRLQSMMQSGPQAFRFKSSDQQFIDRYANNDHLPQLPSGWQRFDASAIELLAGFRRVATDQEVMLAGESPDSIDAANAAGEEIPQRDLEVAPGGGRYWIEDPNAAWW